MKRIPKPYKEGQRLYDRYSQHQQAFRGNVGGITRWLVKGGDVNARGYYGETLLHAAVLGHATTVVELLLAHGADPNACADASWYHVCPLQDAAYDGLLDIVELLIAHGADTSVQTENGCTVLHQAVFNNNAEVMQYLLEQGADPNLPASCDVSPLRSATMHSFYEASLVLLEAGADPNAEDWYSMTALSEVSDSCIAELLITYGADVHHVGRNGRTPIFSTGSLEALNVLLAHDARLDIVDIEGNTLLHEAAEWMCIFGAVADGERNETSGAGMRIAELFIERGMDINVRNHAGQTPLAVALKQKNEPLATFLREHGGVV
jgi:ankyrin repeat protein